MHSAKASQLLEALPEACSGALSLRTVDPQGRVELVGGDDDGTEIVLGEDGVHVSPVPGRAALTRPIDDLGTVAVVTFDATAEQTLRPFVLEILDALREKELFQLDLTSIHASSLALLEEVSMVGDTLPRLPTAGSEVAIAEMGLEALVVAASVQRGLYVSFDADFDHYEVLVHVETDDDARGVRSVPYPGAAELVGDTSALVREAVRASGVVMRSVPDGVRLGVPGSPESLAVRELVAVPVHYGAAEKREVLGALLIMDKRKNAYSDFDRLGSQESKLAMTIAAMLGSVLGARKVAELDKELGMANSIQQQILPQRAPRIAGFDLAGRCSTSGAVGGDYFDFIPMEDGRIMAVVADVSGHNLASGMIMVGARATLRALAASGRGIVPVFDALATSLYPDLNRTERFITAVAAGLMPGRREIELVSAGHNDTMIYRRDSGTVERVPSGSTVLGFLPEPEHERHTTVLGPGDVLLLYTDGMVEAADSDEVMFGEDRLADKLAEAAGGSAEEILHSLFAAVQQFAGRGAGDDDITAVVVKVNGESS